MKAQGRRVQTLSGERTSCAAKVRAASNVQEALLSIAEGIDALLAAEKSDWMTWGEQRKPSANFGSIADALGDEEYDRRVAEIRQTNDGTEVVLPAASAEKQASRAAFEAARLNLKAYLGDGEDWNTAYAKGGPMWLYLANRDLVLSYPIDVQRAMVADVEEDDPRAAQEMGRDILKAPCEPGPGSPGMRTAEGDVG